MTKSASSHGVVQVAKCCSHQRSPSDWIGCERKSRHNTSILCLQINAIHWKATKPWGPSEDPEIWLERIRASSRLWLPEIGSPYKDSSREQHLHKILNPKCKNCWSFLPDLQNHHIVTQTQSKSFPDLFLTVFLCSIEYVSPGSKDRPSMQAGYEQPSSKSLFSCPMLCSATLLSHQYLEIKKSSTVCSSILILYNGEQCVCVLRISSYILLIHPKNE